MVGEEEKRPASSYSSSSSYLTAQSEGEREKDRRWREGEEKDNMALFFFFPASIPSSSPQVHFESELGKPFSCQQVMNHLI